MKSPYQIKMEWMVPVMGVLVILAACNQKNGDSDGGNASSAGDSVCGGDPTTSSNELCAEICESNITQAECEATRLPPFTNGGGDHGCLWYTGTEVVMGDAVGDAGVCTFGEEKRGACGYAVSGDISWTSCISSG